MKKTIVTFAALTLIGAGAAQARSLSPAQALSRALTDGDTPASVSQMRAPSRVQADITLNVLNSNEPALYVISRGEGNGFVIVSADDAVAPLLGYSDNDLDLDNIPDNFRWWLSEYQAEISAGLNSGATAYEAPAMAARQAIEPLCTTKWDQDAPYNDLCPKSGSRSTYAGCVAVAMAQVIKYHNYPEKGTGTHSYRWGSERLEFDYANTTFQWDLMLDRYSGSASSAQRNAVATLVYGCGVGVDMGYGTSASGAQSTAVPGAMREYFGYDKGISMAVRLAYSSEEWENMIYDQLANVGPIYYSGRGESGGHAFVCDGYKEGMFHFNWGWSGVSDGYYRLTRLVPGTQGIGGNSDGFNTDQNIILNARKPQEGSTLPDPYIMCTTPLTASVSGTTLSLPCTFISYTPYSMTSGRLALRIYDWDTNELIRTFNGSNAAWQPGSGYSRLSFALSGLTAGHYRGDLMFLYNNVYYPVRHITLDTGSFEITRTASKLTVEAIKAGNLQWGQLALVSPMYSNKIFGLSIPYSYDGDKDIWYQLTPILKNGSVTVAKGEMLNTLITPGSGEVDYAGSWLNVPAPGDYELELVDGNSKSLGSINVTVQTYSGSNASFITVSSSDWMITSTVADNIVIDATAKSTVGYFAGTLSARIFDKGSTTPMAQFDSRPLFINKGESSSFILSGPFFEGVPGQMYDVSIYNGNTKLSGPKEFLLAPANTGIDDVIATDEETPAVYYNLQGQIVSNPAPGSIVIRRQGNKVEKILVK